jgi:hypothetical protein
LALLVLPPGQFGASSIECKTVSAPGTFDTSAGKLELSKSLLINKYQPALAECTVTGDIASQCQLGSKEIIFNAESAPLAPSLEAIVFQPEGTSTVATFALVNKPSKTCALSVKGTYALGGHYSCKLPEASVEKLEHELSCAGALTFPSEQTAALSYAQMLSLSGTQKGKKFSIFESR